MAQTTKAGLYRALTELNNETRIYGDTGEGHIFRTMPFQARSLWIVCSCTHINSTECLSEDSIIYSCGFDLCSAISGSTPSTSFSARNFSASSAAMHPEPVELSVSLIISVQGDTYQHS
jgi:hypothetical protein